jgi:hypothetical protein
MKIRMINGRVSVIGGAAETKAIKEVVGILDVINETGAAVSGDGFTEAVMDLVKRTAAIKADQFDEAKEKE